MTLREYLDSRCLIHARFAAKIGIKKSIFCRYVNGSRKPPKEAAVLIKKESQGKITGFDSIIDS